MIFKWEFSSSICDGYAICIESNLIQTVWFHGVFFNVNNCGCNNK